jgi:inositol phosphorylceramide mannosyltransferase catalytic subunit
MSIPKIIHQIWIQGYNQIPNKLKNFHLHCKIINNDYEFIVWDETSIKKLLEKFGEKYIKLYDSHTIFAQKADIARYAILYIYGGIYLDMDMICRKNLSSLLNFQVFLTTGYPSFLNFMINRYYNGIIGAIPNHPVFQFVFKNIFERQNSKDKVLYSTGPILLYDSVIEYIKTTGKNDITVIDRKYIHPCSPYDDDLCPFTCDSCYVAHTNDGSWYSSFVKNFYKYAKFKNIYILMFLIILLIMLINIYKLGSN